MLIEHTENGIIRAFSYVSIIIHCSQPPPTVFLLSDQYLTLPPFYIYLWAVVCDSYPCSSMGGFSPRLLSDVLIKKINLTVAFVLYDYISKHVRCVFIT